MAEFMEATVEGLAISDGAQRCLRKFCEIAIAKLGDQLTSISVYGSAVRGEWDAATSDLNVMICVREVSFSALADASDRWASVRRKARISMMILTPDELQRSQDVFCIKFQDIQRWNACLYGECPFQEIRATRAQMRFVIEFELRNISLRMRQQFVQGRGRNVELPLLLKFYSSSLFPLRALVQLHRGEAASPSTRDAIDEVADVLKSDVSSMKSLYDLHRNGKRKSPDAVADLYREFNALVCRAVEVVDTVEVDG